MGKKRYFQCSKCKAINEVGFMKMINSMHLFDIWLYLKCPICGKYNWVKRVKHMTDKQLDNYIKREVMINTMSDIFTKKKK